MMPNDVRDLYQEIILRHARAPLHQGRLDPADARARGENPLCGDSCDITLRLGPGRRIAKLAWEGRGCALMLASADLMAEAARDRAPDEIRDLAVFFETLVATGEANPALGDLQAFGGLAEYPARRKCATLPWAALHAALAGDQEATSE